MKMRKKNEPSWLVNANKLWEMKVYNLRERPSSNFKPKHPITGPLLWPKGRQVKRGTARVSGGFCLRER